jgi:hypothetical protein
MKDSLITTDKINSHFELIQPIEISIYSSTIHEKHLAFFQTEMRSFSNSPEGKLSSRKSE